MLVECVIDGAHRAGADALLDTYAADERAILLSAAHGLIEANSAVRRLARRGELSADDGAQAISWLADLDLVLDASAPRLRRMWALREGMSAYDAAYAAAAESLGAPLITADGKLLEACRSAGIEAVHLSDLAY